MEGLLVILVSAISLSLFLQQQKEGQPNTNNRYFHWDSWAKQENFTFTRETNESPMSIVAEISPYTVYIYAKPKPHTDSASKEERFYTEIRVPLRYTIASGFWMQSRKGLEKIRLTKTAKLLQFSRGTMDEQFFVEAKDSITGQWVLNEAGYREVIDIFKDLPVKSRLEQRNIVWVTESVDIIEVAQEIAKAVQAANNLDTESVKIWKKWSEELNWSLHRQHGYPMLWGRHLGVRTQVSIPDTLNPYIEFSAEFPNEFPKDLCIWGIGFVKEGQNIPRIAGDQIWFQKGTHPDGTELPNNQEIMTYLLSLFIERPKSSLINRRLCIRFIGKENTVLDKHLRQWLSLCEALHKHFIPTKPEQDVIEVLDGIS